MSAGIKLDDPCYYCGCSFDHIANNGCGSKEFPQVAVNKWCGVKDHVARNSKRAAQTDHVGKAGAAL